MVALSVNEFSAMVRATAKKRARAEQGKGFIQ